MPVDFKAEDGQLITEFIPYRSLWSGKSESFVSKFEWLTSRQDYRSLLSELPHFAEVYIFLSLHLSEW